MEGILAPHQGCSPIQTLWPSLPPPLKQWGPSTAPSGPSGLSARSPRPVPSQSRARGSEASPASWGISPDFQTLVLCLWMAPGHRRHCIPPTFPQLRQWCFRRMTVKGALHAVQKPQASSGTHSGGSVTTTVGDTSARGSHAAPAIFYSSPLDSFSWLWF